MIKFVIFATSLTNNIRKMLITPTGSTGSFYKDVDVPCFLVTESGGEVDIDCVGTISKLNTVDLVNCFPGEVPDYGIRRYNGLLLDERIPVTDELRSEYAGMLLEMSLKYS